MKLMGFYMGILLGAPPLAEAQHLVVSLKNQPIISTKSKSLKLDSISWNLDLTSDES